MPVYAAPGRAMHYFDNLLYDQTTGAWTPTHNNTGPTAFLVNLLDGSSTGSTFSGAWSGSPLVNGDGLEAYTGNKIYMHRVILRGQLQLPTIIGNASTAFCIVYDRAPRGVLPAVTDIFDSTSIYALQRVDNRSRFEILYRKDYNMECTGTAVAGPTVIGVNTTSTQHNVLLDIPVMRVLDTNLAGSNNCQIANIVRGALYLLTLSEGNGVPSPPNTPSPGVFGASTSPMLFMRARVLFHDFA